MWCAAGSNSSKKEYLNLDRKARSFLHQQNMALRGSQALYGHIGEEVLLSPQDASAEQNWGYLIDIIYNTVLSIFSMEAWKWAYSDEKMPAIEANHTALAQHKWTQAKSHWPLKQPDVRLSRQPELMKWLLASPL